MIEIYPDWADVEPTVDPDSRSFWDGLENEQLVVPRCATCARLVYPATSTCPHCGSSMAPARQEVLAGPGRVYSWTTVHVALDPAFRDETPYTVVAVDYDRDVRVLGRYLDDPASLTGDSQVDLTPYRVGRQALPGFRAYRH